MRARLRSSFRNFFRRAQMERELDSELLAYIELLTSQNIRSGMSSNAARRAALLELGGVTQVKEQIREAKAGAFLDSLRQDTRYAIRVLRKSPSFFAVSVITLALGVGVTTALFSIVDAVLLRSLPYPDANRLAWIAEINESGNPMSVSYPDFKDWRQQNKSFESIAGYEADETSISTSDAASRTRLALVTQDFFKVLGVPPVSGREFAPDEHKIGAPPLLVIADQLWHGLFGGDPHVIGRRVKIVGGVPAIVIGVMPPGFDFPDKTQVWTQAELTNEGLESRTAHNFRVIGRLRQGIGFRQATNDVNAISRRIKQEYPSPYQAKGGEAISLQERLVGSVKPALLTLFAAVGLVLLIVCVNVASLLVARGTARSRELAIRGALGAGRGRLIRQLTVESLILAAGGGASGILLAFWAIRAIKLFVPSNIPRIETAGINLQVFLFAALISAGCALLFGLIPAWSAVRVDVNTAVKEVSQQHTASRSLRRGGNLLVVSEIALAFMLLVGAVLLVRSFEHLRHETTGFNPRNVLTAKLTFPVTSLNSNAPVRNYVPEYQAIAASVRALPGVRGVAFGSDVPLNGNTPDGHFWIKGHLDLPGMMSDANYRVVSPDYFRVLGITLRQGRFFSESDGTTTEPVAIINATMARRIFPHNDAIGQRIWFDSFDVKEQWMTIIGIVNDARDASLNQPAEPSAFVCYSQHLDHLMENYLIVKTDGDPIRFVGSARQQIHAVNKNVPPTFDTLQNIFNRSISHQRFEAQMLLSFAWLAVLLAAIGIYGVLSYLVDRTQAEIGVRMALGADTRTILSGIIGRGLRAAGLGAVVGIAGVAMIVKTLSSMLYQITVFDPFSYLIAIVTLLATVIVASYVPARRATRIDPIHALKYE